MYLNYQTIGKRIRLLRKQQHLSQLTLAEMVDKSPTYISLVENGQKGPSLEMLIDVANALTRNADRCGQCAEGDDGRSACRVH